MPNLNDSPSLGPLTEDDLQRPWRARVTPTRRTLWHRVCRRVRIAWLRFEIDSAEKWMADCARDGIYDSIQLSYLRKQVAALRVRLALAEAS